MVRLNITGFDCKLCIILSLLVLMAESVCGNGIVEAGQQCDDGNTNIGDGCDGSCKVEINYRCGSSSPSLCKYAIQVNLNYLGALRTQSENTAQLFFLLDSYYPQFKSFDFNSLITHDMGTYVQYVEYLQSSNCLRVHVDYSTSLQNVGYNFQVMFSTTNYFWYDSVNLNTQLKGANCELTYNDNLWMYSVMKYVFLGLVIIANCVFIASIFFQKWIGLELIHTFQAIYYNFILMNEFPYQFIAMIRGLKYSNGYNDITTPDYLRTYPLSNSLNSLGIQKQFLSNVNIMLAVIGVPIITQIILTILKSKYTAALEQHSSTIIKKKLAKLQVAINFIFDRVVMMLAFYMMFLVISSCCIQFNTLQSTYFIQDNSINIFMSMLTCCSFFVIFFYLTSWYVFLPNNFTEGDIFMRLSFKNMKFYYPLLYIMYKLILIMLISIFYTKDFTEYLVLGLEVVYLLLIIVLRPYNTTINRQFNKKIHYISIIFNQVIVISVTSMILRWNSILMMGTQNDSGSEMTIYSFIILAFLTLAVLLTIFRLIIFDREMKYCCCKLQEVEEDILHENNAKSQEKENINERDLQQHDGVGSLKPPQYIKKESTLKKKGDEMELLLQNQNINRFLNENYIVWANGKQSESTSNKKSLRNIKKSSQMKYAQYIKSPLQEFLEMKSFYKEENQKH